MLGKVVPLLDSFLLSIFPPTGPKLATLASGLTHRFDAYFLH